MGLKRNYAILLIFALIVITAAEMIGTQSLSLGAFSISLLPLAFAILITMILGLPIFRKGFLQKIYSKANVQFSSKYLIFIMLPLMARYGADVAPQLKEILNVGWVFIAQELGNLGTVLLGLPVALLIGLRREAIGATLGLGREGELAYISEKYTLESKEGRGSAVALYNRDAIRDHFLQPDCADHAGYRLPRGSIGDGIRSWLREYDDCFLCYIDRACP